MEKFRDDSGDQWSVKTEGLRLIKVRLIQSFSTRSAFIISGRVARYNTEHSVKSEYQISNK